MCSVPDLGKQPQTDAFTFGLFAFTSEDEFVNRFPLRVAFLIWVSSYGWDVPDQGFLTSTQRTF